MKFERIEYVDAERPENQNTLRVSGDGVAVLERRFSGAALSEGEIGSYEGWLSEDAIDAIAAIAADPAFAATPDDTGRLPAGVSYRIVRVHSTAATVEKTAAWDSTTNPALNRLMSLLEKSANELTAHPRRVARLQLTRAEIASDGVMTGTILVRNLGVERVSVRNPLAAAAIGGFPIEAWPDRADVRANEVVRATGHFVNDPAVRQPPLVELTPGEERTYQFRTGSVWNLHGPCRVRMLFNDSALPGAPQPEPSGEIYTAPAKISVP